jgi:hypothetical protein
VFCGVAEGELVFMRDIWHSVNSGVPKICSVDPKVSAATSKGSVDTFLNGFFYVFLLK